MTNCKRFSKSNRLFVLYSVRVIRLCVCKIRLIIVLRVGTLFRFRLVIRALLSLLTGIRKRRALIRILDAVVAPFWSFASE